MGCKKSGCTKRRGAHKSKRNKTMKKGGMLNMTDMSNMGKNMGAKAKRMSEKMTHQAKDMGGMMVHQAKV